MDGMRCRFYGPSVLSRGSAPMSAGHHLACSCSRRATTWSITGQRPLSRCPCGALIVADALAGGAVAIARRCDGGRWRPGGRGSGTGSVEVDGAGVSGPVSSGGEDRCAAASVLGAAAGAEAEAGAAATGGCAGRAPRGRARPEAREAGVYATTGRGSGLSGRTAAVAEVAQLPDHGAVGARDVGPGRALDRREVERPAEAKHACAAAGVIMQCELGRMPGAARRDLERVTHARVRPTVSLLALRDLCTRRLRLMPIVGQDLHPARRQAGGLPDTRSTGSSVRGGPAPRRR